MTSSSAVALARHNSPGVIGAENEFFDILLEALSYLNDSAWSGFEQVFASVDAVAPSPFDSPRDAARVLSALGHIDLSYDKRSVRPIGWSAAPPTLLRLAERQWLLAGRRSSSLVSLLERRCGAADTPIDVEPLPTQPSRITVNAEHELVRSIVEYAQRKGVELCLNNNTAATLAAALPALGDVIEALQRGIPASGGSIEKLEYEGGGRLVWRRVYDFSSVGAYRFDPPPLTYVFVDADGARPARVDARLARLLTVVQRGVPPLAWDPLTGIATAWYYAEPPGLFERALSLSGGYGPEPAPYERITRYRAVPEDVAHAVFARLTSLGRE